MTWQDAGILLTFLLGAWNLVSNLRNSKRTTFINTVTSERVKWIQNMRESISTLCGRTYYWVMTQDELSPEDSNAVRKDVDRLRMLVKLQLNPKGTLDNELIRLVEEIPKVTHKLHETQLKSLLDEIVRKSQLLLKEEWDKVRDESIHGDLRRRGFFKRLFV